MTTRPRARTLLCLVVLAGAGSGAMSTFAVSATGDAIRTDSNLGGFSISSNAAPFKVLLDDPANPIPRPPDSAILEADPAYTEADLASGPTARGIASSLWPGNLIGEGLATATNNQSGPYPLKAEARYPDKPYTADGSLDLRGNHITSDQGALMHATAMGLDVAATAKFNPTDVPSELDLGTVTSTSTATVTKADVAVGRSTSRISDVTLLGGVIQIGSVSTVVETRSDGKRPSSSGTTVVSGLSVGGVGYVVDEKGARPVGAPIPGSPPLPGNALDPAKAAGITIEGIAQSGSQDADSATRDAKGLVISIDTVLLRKTLDTYTPGPVTSALYGLFSQVVVPVPGVPDERGMLYYTLAASPRITFVLGAGQSSSVANLPISFTFPPITGGPTGLPISGGGPGIGTGGQTGPPPVAPGTTGGTPKLPESGGPQIAPTSGGPPVLAGVVMPRSKGIPALLLLGAALLASVAGWGLTRLRGFAFGGGLLGAGCPLGAPSTLPDLHADTQGA